VNKEQTFAFIFLFWVLIIFFRLLHQIGSARPPWRAEKLSARRNVAEGGRISTSSYQSLVCCCRTLSGFRHKQSDSI